jgi:hypothetical protein
MPLSALTTKQFLNVNFVQLGSQPFKGTEAFNFYNIRHYQPGAWIITLLVPVKYDLTTDTLLNV